MIVAFNQLKSALRDGMGGGAGRGSAVGANGQQDFSATNSRAFSLFQLWHRKRDTGGESWATWQSMKFQPSLFLLVLVLALVIPSRAGVRIATFNASMNRSTEGRLLTELTSGTSSQIRRVAEVIQIVRPDILLINEFDYDADESGAEAVSRQLPLGGPARQGGDRVSASIHCAVEYWSGIGF
jgi:hypothetical protein